MISLKHLFTIMGTISLLMMVAVVMVKIKSPEYVTLAEVRAIDRICQRYADDMMSHIADEAIKDEVTFLKQLHGCMGACREYLVQSRGKGVTIGGHSPMNLPECFGDGVNSIKGNQDQVDSQKKDPKKEGKLTNKSSEDISQ